MKCIFRHYTLNAKQQRGKILIKGQGYLHSIDLSIHYGPDFLLQIQATHSVSGSGQRDNQPVNHVASFPEERILELSFKR